MESNNNNNQSVNMPIEDNTRPVDITTRFNDNNVTEVHTLPIHKSRSANEADTIKQVNKDGSKSPKFERSGSRFGRKNSVYGGDRRERTTMYGAVLSSGKSIIYQPIHRIPSVNSDRRQMFGQNKGNNNKQVGQGQDESEGSDDVVTDWEHSPLIASSGVRINNLQTLGMFGMRVILTFMVMIFCGFMIVFELTMDFDNNGGRITVYIATITGLIGYWMPTPKFPKAKLTTSLAKIDGHNSNVNKLGSQITGDELV